MTSPALAYILAAWNAIPGGSWQRINSGMSSTLHNAVVSGMPFALGDLTKMPSLGSWIGAAHEHLYAAACGGKRGAANPSFCQEYEHWRGREPFLWPEETKTPTRLHVGAKLTWKGHRVTVTSFSTDGTYLTAVTYKEERERAFAVGYKAYLHDGQGAYRTIEALARSEEGHLMVRYSPPAEGGNQSSSIERRFTIPLADLKAARKQYDDRRRGYERQIAAAENIQSLEVIKASFAAENPRDFRHFDVEMIREAFGAKVTAIREKQTVAEEQTEEESARHNRERLAASHDADLARWMAGEDVNRYFDVVRLRVKGAWVETSTQQQATVSGVRAALTFVKKHRKGWTQNGSRFDLDQYPLKEINGRGVQVGCTFVEWAEVDRIAKQLTKKSK